MNPFQCICSDSTPQGVSDPSKCSFKCSGDPSIQMCGGLGYINIFHTNARDPGIHDEACANIAQDDYYQRWFEDMAHCSGMGGKFSETFTFMV